MSNNPILFCHSKLTLKSKFSYLQQIISIQKILVDLWAKILFTFDRQIWNSITQLTVLGSKHYVKRLLAIFHSPYFFRVPSSSPRFYVKNLLSFMSPIWNKIIWNVSRVGFNQRLFTTVKHEENYRKNIQPGRSHLYSIWCCRPAFYL